MFTVEELKVLKYLVDHATYKGINEAKFVIALDTKISELLEEADGNTENSSE